MTNSTRQTCRKTTRKKLKDLTQQPTQCGRGKGPEKANGVRKKRRQIRAGRGQKRKEPGGAIAHKNSGESEMSAKEGVRLGATSAKGREMVPQACPTGLLAAWWVMNMKKG